MGSVDGTGFEYRYDTKNHLTQAANSEGVRYRFTYNDKGQPIRMTAESILGQSYRAECIISGKKFLEIIWM